VVCVHTNPPSLSTGQRLTERSPGTLRFQSGDLRVPSYTSIRQRPGRLAPDSTFRTRQPRRAYPNKPAQRAMCATGQRLTRRSPGTLRLQPGDLRVPGYTPIRQRPGRLAPGSTSGTRMGLSPMPNTHETTGPYGTSRRKRVSPNPLGVSSPTIVKSHGGWASG
jgi:hypothetical protein